MKRIRVENGKMIAYISQSDLEALIKIRDLVPGALFYEESIVSGCPNSDGYYRIEDIYNVSYIKTSDFIPNEDFHEKLSLMEVRMRLDEARENHKALQEVLKKLYGRSELDESDQTLLAEYDAIRRSNVDEMQQKAKARNDWEKELRFIILEECLMAQSEHYVNSLAVFEMRRSEEEKENDSKHSSFIKRLFKRR